MDRQLQDARAKTTFTPAGGLMLQRACACGNQTHGSAGCEACEAKHGLQRSAINNSPGGAVAADVNAVLTTRGAPLEATTRAFMEPRFGQDFSAVRVHTGPLAAQSARSVSARAYTVGNHIVFGEGAYDPASRQGRRLIAHELTHTIQQRGGPAMPQAQGLRVSEPGDRLEREADAVAKRVTAGGNVDGAGFTQTSLTAGGARPLLLQRDNGDDDKKDDAKKNAKKPDKPLIPMPVFDEFDPAIIVPDIPGLPGFVKGQKVALSDLKKALDILRGKKKGGSDSKVICDLIPGMEISTGSQFTGQCCEKHKRDAEHCCTWRNLSLKDGRCCHKDEVLLPSNSCFKPQIAPTTPTPAPPATQPSGTTPFPRLELKVPKVRFGTIEATTIDKFASNSAAVPAAFDKDLDHLAALLKIYKEAEIHIEGHTDSSYTEEYNKGLSDRRADAVKKALVKRGVSTAKMTVTGLGESQLRYPAESNEAEKAGNRRVEVWFYTPPSKTMAEELQLPTP